MQDHRLDIQLLARAHQYRLHPFALKSLSDYISGVSDDNETQRRILQDFFSVLHKQCAANRFVDEATIRSAITQQSIGRRKMSEVEGAPKIIHVPLDDIPHVYIDERSGEMKVQPKCHDADRFSVLRQRYLLARRRCLRSGLFRRDLNKLSLDNELMALLPSIALEGIEPSEHVAVVGMILKVLDEFYMEDLNGRFKLILPVDRAPLSTVLGDGFFVVAKGRWVNGTFTVSCIDLPPAERREDTLRDVGADYDLFGHRPADSASAYVQEKNSLQSVLIVIAHVYLDRPSTISRLISFFKEMQNRTEGELADTTIVLVGDFSSAPVHYEDVSHLTEPFDGSDRYKTLMDTLAALITTYAPGVAQHTQIILVPGPNDATSLLGVLPQPPVVGTFTKTLQARLKKVVFAPNPCRLRFFTHEVIVARRDFFRSLQESGRSFHWSKLSERTPMTTFECVAKTILDEAHLAPEVKEGILWKADDALRLPILPHTLVLCDSTEQWECSYKGVHVVNPGSFALATTFLWYTPADGVCSLSSIDS